MTFSFLCRLFDAIPAYDDPFAFVGGSAIFGLIVVGVVFLVTAFASSPDWGAIAHGLFVPALPEEGSKGILTAVGLIGTTIVPYNLFLHASSAAERWKDPDQIGDARFDAVLSIGLGGGSIVRQHEDGTVTVGPDSVGYRITEKALVFGGDTLTATDVAVKLKLADIGDKSKVEQLDYETARKAMEAIRSMVEDSIDAMKVSSADIDVILVGGGSIIIPDQLAGTKSVVKPDYFGTANAIGSAISKVSGTLEQLINYDETPREAALSRARSEAVELAVEAGAVRETVEIIEVEDVPLAYYPGNTNRVKVKAAGDLV